VLLTELIKDQLKFVSAAPAETFVRTIRPSSATLYGFNFFHGGRAMLFPSATRRRSARFPRCCGLWRQRRPLYVLAVLASSSACSARTSLPHDITPRFSARRSAA